jgi:hypothetical protein
MSHYPGLVSVRSTGSTGEVAEAVSLVEKAMALAPDNPDVIFLYAAVLFLAMQGASATAVLEDLVSTHPDHWLAHRALQDFAVMFSHLLWPPWPEDGRLLPGIARVLHTTIDCGFRDGLMPLVVVLTRLPSREGMSAADFLRQPLECAVVDTGITSPLVTALVFRLGGPRRDALITELPGFPLQDAHLRLRWEVILRRGSVPLVNCEADRIVGVRLVRFGPRGRQVAQRLANLIGNAELRAYDQTELLRAVQTYQNAMPLEALSFEPAD